MCISNTFPGDTDAAGLRTALGEPADSETSSTFYTSIANLRTESVRTPARANVEDPMPGCPSESPAEFLVLFLTWMPGSPTSPTVSVSRKNEVQECEFHKVTLERLIMTNSNFLPNAEQSLPQHYFI